MGPINARCFHFDSSLLFSCANNKRTSASAVLRFSSSQNPFKSNSQLIFSNCKLSSSSSIKNKSDFTSIDCEKMFAALFTLLFASKIVSLLGRSLQYSREEMAANSKFRFNFGVNKMFLKIKFLVNGIEEDSNVSENKDQFFHLLSHAAAGFQRCSRGGEGKSDTKWEEVGE